MRNFILGLPRFSLSAFAMRAGDETLGVLELDENLSDAERPPELTAGKYPGEVQDVQIGTSQGKGNQYYAIRFVVASEDIPIDLREHYPDGVVLGWNRTLVPIKGDRRALYNLRKLIESLGLSSQTTTIDPNEWMGRRAMLHIGLGNVFQGERRAEIKSIEPLDDAPPARVVASKGTKAARGANRSARGARA